MIKINMYVMPSVSVRLEQSYFFSLIHKVGETIIWQINQD